jgi:SAM-dependent methyltransferase
VYKLIRYFLFLATNWNLKIAHHIISNEIRGNKKYGIDSTGADNLKSLQKKEVDISHATIYMPASYDVLERIFEFMKKLHIQDMTDLGCGKGRALCVAAHYGFNDLTGVELSKSFCETSLANLKITAQKIPGLQYRVINNDAFYYDIPESCHCIFLFNPFDDFVLNRVLERIDESLKSKPRNFYIIYLNPVYRNSLIQHAYTSVFQWSEMVYLEAEIFKKTLPLT